MVGPVFPTTTHDRTYANAYRSRFAGTILYDASFALAKNPAIVEQMLRDPIIKQAVGDTCAAIADSTWQVQPYSQRPDDVAWAAHLQELAQCCEIGFVKTIRMLARAYFTGEEWADPRWRIVSEQLADDDQERRYAVVRSMKHVDRRRLMRRIVREEGKEPRIAWFLSAVFHAGEWANYSELDGKDGRKSRS
ncbi:MAG: phage portal protein family protein, partial [Mycobacterium sp.]